MLCHGTRSERSHSPPPPSSLASAPLSYHSHTTPPPSSSTTSSPAPTSETPHTSPQFLHLQLLQLSMQLPAVRTISIRKHNFRVLRFLRHEHDRFLRLDPLQQLTRLRLPPLRRPRRQIKHVSNNAIPPIGTDVPRHAIESWSSKPAHRRRIDRTHLCRRIVGLNRSANFAAVKSSASAPKADKAIGSTNKKPIIARWANDDP